MLYGTRHSAEMASLMRAIRQRMAAILSDGLTVTYCRRRRRNGVESPFQCKARAATVSRTWPVNPSRTRTTA